MRLAISQDLMRASEAAFAPQPERKHPGVGVDEQYRWFRDGEVPGGIDLTEMRTITGDRLLEASQQEPRDAETA